MCVAFLAYHYKGDKLETVPNIVGLAPYGASESKLMYLSY